VAHHRFKVGQRVNFRPARIELPASIRQYVIVRLLPSEEGQMLYRIKSPSENFERVAREDQLSGGQ